MKVRVIARARKRESESVDYYEAELNGKRCIIHT